MRKWALYILLAAVGAYFTLSAISMFLYGSGYFRGKRRFDALDAARPTAPYISDFVRLFPEAHVNYRYFKNGDEPGFNVTAVLYGRYELTMQLPVDFDQSRRHVVGYGEPNFYLLEVKSVSRDGVISFNSRDQKTFRGAGWQKIVKAHGDFRAIGYDMVTNQPVPGFTDHP